MAPEKLDAYVRNALELQGYQLDVAQTERVLAQFLRIEAIAQVFLVLPLPLPLPFDAEPAPVFRL
jgi:Protein of unknown function (DUF4089)